MHLETPENRCACGKEGGEATLLMKWIDCGACLVYLDDALEKGLVAEIAHAGMTWVKWRADLIAARDLRRAELWAERRARFRGRRP